MEEELISGKELIVCGGTERRAGETVCDIIHERRIDLKRKIN